MTPLTYEEWLEMEKFAAEAKAVLQRALCQHTNAVMLGHRRVTRVRNRQRGMMYKLSCTCGGQVAFGPSNDRIPRDELALAGMMALVSLAS